MEPLAPLAAIDVRHVYRSPASLLPSAEQQSDGSHSQSAVRYTIEEVEEFTFDKNLSDSDFHVLHRTGLDHISYLEICRGSLMKQSLVWHAIHGPKCENQIQGFHYDDFLSANIALSQICNEICSNAFEVHRIETIDKNINALAEMDFKEFSLS